MKLAVNEGRLKSVSSPLGHLQWCHHSEPPPPSLTIILALTANSCSIERRIYMTRNRCQ
ncbi:hypothetical protein BDZ91DRAFT_721971 [Kalaharituber pfeilii]|nr:hypothetical protein BDZ91DRAFT_721971 [Kalaharituber pfeilii]